MSIRRVKLFRLIEMKKMILKAKSMKTYFATNPKEKAIILQTLQKMSRRFYDNRVEIPETVPGYLIPDFLKKDAK